MANAETALGHKDLAKHIRGRLAQANIPARVIMMISCGEKAVKVVAPSYDFRWTANQLELIARIARVNHLTFVRGLPVTEAHCVQMTEKTSFEFYLAA